MRKLNIIAIDAGEAERAKSIVKKYTKMNKGDPDKVRKDILNYIVYPTNVPFSKSFIKLVWDAFRQEFPEYK